MAGNGLRIEATFTDGSRWVCEVPTRDKREALKLGRKAAAQHGAIREVRLADEQHAFED